jgi:hypothetical protein
VYHNAAAAITITPIDHARLPVSLQAGNGKNVINELGFVLNNGGRLRNESLF